MATRCPACGEFMGDNTFGKHNCGKAINWNAVELASTDAEIARLTALLAEAREGLQHLSEFTRYDPGYPYSYNAETACKILNEMRYAARAILAKLGA